MEISHSLFTDSITLLAMESDLDDEKTRELKKAVNKIQKENWSLRKELEMARIRYEATTIQLAAEKARDDDIVQHSEREFKILEKKLQYAESTVRKLNLLRRDENTITSTMTSSEFHKVLEEYNKMKDQIVRIGEESTKKTETIMNLMNELQAYRSRDEKGPSKESIDNSHLIDEYEAKISTLQKAHDEEVETLEFKIKDLEVQIIQTEDMLTSLQNASMTKSDSSSRSSAGNADLANIMAMAELQNEIISLRNMRATQLKQLQDKRTECKNLKQEKTDIMDAFARYIKESNHIIQKYQSSYETYAQKIESLSKDLESSTIQVKTLHELLKKERKKSIVDSLPVIAEPVLTSPQEQIDVPPKSEKKQRRMSKSLNDVKRGSIVPKAPSRTDFKPGSLSVTSEIISPKSKSLQINHSEMVIDRKAKSFQEFNVNPLPIIKSDVSTQTIISEENLSLITEEEASIINSVTETVVNKQRQQLETILEDKLSNENISNIVDRIIKPMATLISKNDSRRTSLQNVQIAKPFRANYSEPLESKNENVKIIEKQNSNNANPIPHVKNQLNLKIKTSDDDSIDQGSSNNDTLKATTESISPIVPVENITINKAMPSPKMSMKSVHQIENTDIQNIDLRDAQEQFNVITENSNYVAPIIPLIETSDLSHALSPMPSKDELSEDIFREEEARDTAFVAEMKESIVSQVGRVSHQLTDLVKATTESALKRGGSKLNMAMLIKSLSQTQKVEKKNSDNSESSLSKEKIKSPQSDQIAADESNSPENISVEPQLINNHSIAENSTDFDILQSEEVDSEEIATLATEILTTIAESMGAQLVQQQKHFNNKQKRLISKNRSHAPHISRKGSKSVSVNSTPTSTMNSRIISPRLQLDSFSKECKTISTDVTGLIMNRSVAIQTENKDKQSSLPGNNNLNTNTNTRRRQSLKLDFDQKDRRLTKMKSQTQVAAQIISNPIPENKFIDSENKITEISTYEYAPVIQPNHDSISSPITPNKSPVTQNQDTGNSSVIKNQESVNSDASQSLDHVNSFQCSIPEEYVKLLEENALLKSNLKIQTKDTPHGTSPFDISMPPSAVTSPVKQINGRVQRSALLSGRIARIQSDVVKKIKTLSSIGIQTDPVVEFDEHIIGVLSKIASLKNIETADKEDDIVVNNSDTSIIDEISTSKITPVNLIDSNTSETAENRNPECVAEAAKVFLDGFFDNMPSDDSSVDQQVRQSYATKNQNIIDNLQDTNDESSVVNTSSTDQLNSSDNSEKIHSFRQRFPVTMRLKNTQPTKSIKVNRKNDKDKVESEKNEEEEETLRFIDTEESNFSPLNSPKTTPGLLKANESLDKSFTGADKNPLLDKSNASLPKHSPRPPKLKQIYGDEKVSIGGMPILVKEEVSDELTIFRNAANRYFAEALNGQFDFLQKELLGGKVLARLTIIEYHFRCQNYEAAVKIQSMTGASQSKLDTRDYFQHHQQLLMKFLQLERGLRRQEVISSYSIAQLAKFKYVANTLSIKMKMLGIWSRLKHLIDSNGKGGYYDILRVHLDVIESCITASGGWKKAFADITKSSESQPMSDTSFWPEEFRIKVLEYLRKSLYDQGNKWKTALTVVENDLSNEKQRIASAEASWEVERQSLRAEIKSLRALQVIDDHSKKSSVLLSHTGPTKRQSNWESTIETPQSYLSNEESNRNRVLCIDSASQTNNPYSGAVTDALNTREGYSSNSINLKNTETLHRDLIINAKRGIIEKSPDESVLPPGYCFAKVDDGKLCLCQGITLAVPSELLKNIALVKSIPRNVIFIHRNPDTELPSEFEEILDDSFPVFENCEAVLVKSSVIKLSLGMYIILSPVLQSNNVVLPWNIICMKIASDKNSMPYGVTQVFLSPILRLEGDMNLIKHGTELVQVHTKTILPPGLSIGNGITIEQSNFIDLPSNVQLIRRTSTDSILPEFMSLIEHTPEKQNSHEDFSNIGCFVCPRPDFLQLPLGQEIIYRPPWFSFPEGADPVPVNSYPQLLSLQPGQELIQIHARFDLPTTFSPHPLWRAFHRPPGLSLPPSYYLLQYLGDDYDDPESLPPFIIPRSLPDNIKLPKNVIVCEFLEQAGYPLPYDTQLSSGLIVVNARANLAPNSKPLPKLMDINIIAVRKNNPDATVPVGIDIVDVTNELFSGVILMENVFLVKIPVRFELPQSVCLSPGAILGPCVQLSCLTLSNNMDILPWPPGIILPRGIQLVKVPSYCPIPYGYNQINSKYVNAYGCSLPKDSVMVELPSNKFIGSTVENTKHITVIDAKKIISYAQNANIDLPPGCAFIRRNAYSTCLPNELKILSTSELSVENRNSLEFMNNCLEEDDSNIGRIDAVSIMPHYSYPAGVELAKGVFTQAAPFWLHLPSWVSLVSFKPNISKYYNNTDNEALSFELKMFLDLSFIKENLTYLRQENLSDKQLMLPRYTVLVKVPKDITVFSWSEFNSSIQAVENILRKDIRGSVYGWCLPPGHFFIEKTRKLADGKLRLPPELELGVAQEYDAILRVCSHINHERRTLISMLPPGVAIAHLRPTYRLPRGVTIESVSALTYYSKSIPNFNSNSTTKPINDLSTIQKYRQYLCPQLAWGQPLSDNHIAITYPGRFQQPVTKDGDDNEISLVIVTINKSSQTHQSQLTADESNLSFGYVIHENQEFIEEYYNHDLSYEVISSPTDSITKKSIQFISVYFDEVLANSVAPTSNNNFVVNNVSGLETVHAYLLLSRSTRINDQILMSPRLGLSERLKKLCKEIDNLRVKDSATSIQLNETIMSMKLFKDLVMTEIADYKFAHEQAQLLKATQSHDNTKLSNDNTNHRRNSLNALTIQPASPRGQNQSVMSPTFNPQLAAQYHQLSQENISLKKYIESSNLQAKDLKNIISMLLKVIKGTVYTINETIIKGIITGSYNLIDNDSFGYKVSSLFDVKISDEVIAKPNLMEYQSEVSPTFHDGLSSKNLVKPRIHISDEADDDISVLSDNNSTCTANDSNSNISKISYTLKKTGKALLSSSMSALKSPRKNQFISGKLPSKSSKPPRHLPPLSMQHHQPSSEESIDKQALADSLGLIQISRPIKLVLPTHARLAKSSANNSISTANDNVSRINDEEAQSVVTEMQDENADSNIKSDIISLPIKNQGTSNRKQIRQRSIALSKQLSEGIVYNLSKLQTSVEALAASPTNEGQSTPTFDLSTLVVPWVQSIASFIQSAFKDIEEHHNREVITLHQETKSVLRQYDIVQKKLSEKDEELKSMRLKSLEPTHNELDRLQSQNAELISMLEILRSQDIKEVSHRVPSRLENLQNIIDLYNYICFQILKTKADVRNELKLRNDEVYIGGDSNDLRKKYMDAKSHYKSALLNKIDNLEKRKDVISKDIEVMVNVIYEDYRDYEQRVRRLLPPKLLSRIHRFLQPLADISTANEPNRGPNDSWVDLTKPSKDLGSFSLQYFSNETNSSQQETMKADNSPTRKTKILSDTNKTKPNEIPKIFDHRESAHSHLMPNLTNREELIGMIAKVMESDEIDNQSYGSSGQHYDSRKKKTFTRRYQ